MCRLFQAAYARNLKHHDEDSGHHHPALPLIRRNRRRRSVRHGYHLRAYCAKNVKSTAKITVAPANGYKLNLDYPVKLTIVAPSGVTVVKSKQTSADAVRFDAKGLEFGVAFTASTPGTKTLTGELRYATCTTTDCNPQVENLKVTVAVQ